MSKNTNYDFCGWVTKNDLECTDGRVIKRNAFAHQDGDKVPLAWNHNHDTPEAVLGYTILENRPEGVYGYSFLNDTQKAQEARLLVQHGDIDSYSIYANHLKQAGSNVYHGDIKEVSLVFSGANPGAYIEDVSFAHSADGEEVVDEAIIYTGETNMAFNDRNFMQHAEEEESNETSVSDVLNSLTDEQKQAVDFYVQTVVEAVVDDLENAEEDEDEYDEDYETEEVEHSDEGEEDMKSNIFDAQTTQKRVLSHSDFEAIKKNAKACGSFKEAYKDYIEDNGFLKHDDDAYDSGMSYAVGEQKYGFNDVDMLFPDYKALDPRPEWIKRDDSWVSVFWGSIHRVPFQKIKSLYADITEDAARAKGYIKGNFKKEEVFKTMKRTTDATTVYKKQKLDKDDINDITDFDVVAWIKAEMRVMLNEEIARAALIGDGRSNVDPDKIDDTKIRPVYLDDDFFVIRYEVDPGNTPDDRAKNFIRGCVKARKQYKGSGNTTMFTTEDLLTDCLLVEDNIGHRLYKTEAELQSATRVSKITTVEVMEGLTNPTNNKPCAAIILNPKDYTVGANNGGKIDMFDDFDIDYNQYKYLLETRCSGCLTKYKSAIVIEFKVSSNPSQD